MAITLIGQSPFTVVKSWPAGSSPGHVGVFVSSPLRASTVSDIALPGWGFAGVSYAFVPLSGVPAAGVWSKVLTSSDLASPPPAVDGSVLVFSGVSRVLQAYPAPGVSVPSGGGGVVVAVSFGAITGGPLTWTTQHTNPRGTVRVGYTTTSVVSQAPGWPLNLVLGAPVGPAAPTLVAPVSGDVSDGLPLELLWKHNATVAGGSQAAYCLEVTTATHGTRFWTGSEWSASETWVSSSTQGVTLPAAVLVAGDAHSWTVRTEEQVGGLRSPKSVAGVFTPVTPPTMTLTGPVSPVVDDLSPTVTWSSVTPQGGQTAFRVWVVSAGQTIADSGVVRSAVSSWTVPPTTPWVRDAAVTIFGQVWQTGGSVSPVASRPLVVSWTPPVTPVVTEVTGAEGVMLTVSGLVPGSPIEVQRLEPSGDWVTILEVTAEGSKGTFTDVFAAYGHPTRWRARQSATLEGVGMVSDWGVSDYIISEDDGAYLGDALDPIRTWIPVLVRSMEADVLHQNVQVSYGLGDTHAVVWSEPEQGFTGQVTIGCMSVGALGELRGLWSGVNPDAGLKPTRRMCFRPHPEYDDGQTRIQPATRWWAVVNPWSESRLVQGPWTYRDVPLQWVEQPVTELGVSMAPLTHPIYWED